MQRGERTERFRFRWRGVLAPIAACLACLGATARAHAEDRVYWVNFSSNTVSFAAINGSGGGTLVPEAKVAKPDGLLIDPASSRVLWVNEETQRAAFANLIDGSGENLETGDFLGEGPSGLAVDPIGGRIYWAKRGEGKIGFSPLDGSFTDNMTTTGATVAQPDAVVVDPGSNRVYWTNAASIGAPVSYASTKGSEAGDLDASAVAGSLISPSGLAVDHADERAYFADGIANALFYVGLHGGGGARLSTGNLLVQPRGIAIDPVAQRLYWLDPFGEKIFYVNLNGSGSGEIPVGKAKTNGARFPVLFFGPHAQKPPTITGGTSAGASLACSNGDWLSDQPESSFYDAPQRFEYQWSRNGGDLAGATSRTFTASVPGSYRCRVTATNLAGSATQTSPPHALSTVAFGKKTGVTIGLASSPVRSGSPVPVLIRNSNEFPITGVLSVGRASDRTAYRTDAKDGKRFKVRASGKAVVALALQRRAQRLLVRRGRLSLPVSATVTDPAGHARTVTHTLILRSSR